MKRFLILFSVTLLVLFLGTLVITCQQKETTEPAATQAPSDSVAKTYTNSEYDFSVQYSKDWDILEDIGGYVVVFAGPRVGEDNYMVNINLSITQLTGDLSLKDCVQIVELNTKRTTIDYQKLDEHTTVIGGESAILITVNATLESHGRRCSLKDLSAVWIKNDLIFVLTYDVPVEFHDDYVDSFDLITSSFKYD